MNTTRAVERREKTANIDLGLAILSVLANPGEPLTLDDIAAWCGCSRQAIENIERRALKKLRNALFFTDRQTWNELKYCFGHERQAAKAVTTKEIPD